MKARDDGTRNARVASHAQCSKCPENISRSHSLGGGRKKLQFNLGQRLIYKESTPPPSSINRSIEIKKSPNRLHGPQSRPGQPEPSLGKYNCSTLGSVCFYRRWEFVLGVGLSVLQREQFLRSSHSERQTIPILIWSRNERPSSSRRFHTNFDNEAFRRTHHNPPRLFPQITVYI